MIMTYAVKNLSWVLSLVLMGSMVLATPAIAANTEPPQTHHITGKSVAAGLLSFLIWPGIGQAINDQKGKKVATHALLGLIPPFRFYSGWDGLVDRSGGYWNGKL
jgi:hypothetical protein